MSLVTDSRMSIKVDTVMCGAPIHSQSSCVEEVVGLSIDVDRRSIP
jgi:hypothetical protein